MLLALVLALTLVTNIIVQVLKSLLYDMLPTNLLAFLVAAVVTVGAGFGLWSYYRFAITGWMIVALIASSSWWPSLRCSVMTNWCS